VIGRVEIDRARMALHVVGTTDGSEPSIQCAGLALEGVRVDGFPLKITLAEDFFNLNNTMSKLAAASASGKNQQLFFPANPSAHYGYPNPTHTTKCTVVSAIEWEGTPNPDVTIDGNAIVVPNYGKVFFGEMYVTSCSRRLTMARFQLGSDDGGDGSAADGDGGGQIWPPQP